MSEGLETEKRLLDVYELQMDGYGFSEAFLKNKKVVDVGCNDMSLAYGLDARGVTIDVFGLDIKESPDIPPRLSRKFLQHDYLQPFPVQTHDADVVVSRAVPDCIDILDKYLQKEAHPDSPMHIQRFVTKLENMLTATKPGGEIRDAQYRLNPGSDPGDQPAYRFIENFCRSRGLRFEFVSVGESIIENSIGNPVEHFDSYVLVIHKPKADNVRT